MDLMQFFNDNSAIIAAIATGLLVVSESLPLTEKVKANGVFQLFVTALKFLARKK